MFSVLNVNVCFSKHKIFSLFDTISQCQWFERWSELWCRLKFVFRISREFVTPVICCHPNNNVVIIWFSILPSILYWTMSITWSCDSTCDTSFRIYSLRCMVEGIPLHCSLVTIRFDHQQTNSTYVLTMMLLKANGICVCRLVKTVVNTNLHMN